MEDKETPYFIKIRGCINCSASKYHKERYGTDYGFDHALMCKCLFMNCNAYGINLTNPFLDPEEIIRLSKKENIRKYLINIKDAFEEYYEKLGISLDKLIRELLIKHH